MSDKKKDLGKKAEEKSEQVLDILPESVSKILDDLPEGKRNELKSALALSFKATYYRGQLPHPDILERFDELIENGAERIFSKFENQSDHRREIESKVINAQIKESSRGQTYGLVIGLVFGVLAFIAAILDHDAFASVFGGTTIVGLVGTFVYGKKSQRKDLKDKE